MSRQINQPINQVRLTNVAVVRMNRGGKRFEIACYKNKVVDYRQGLEKDLSEVLQTDRIFTNVSKGEFAKAKDLQKVFGTKDEEEIATMILSKGQVQVSDKERSQQLDKTTAQIAEWISKNCVQKNSDRPYTISQIRHAMQQANFSVHPTKPLKRQYLDCVKLLQEVIPIQRAKMELHLLIPNQTDSTRAVEESMRDNRVAWSSTIVESISMVEYQILVDPSLYRILNEVIQEIDTARIEIVTQVVTRQDDNDLESSLPAIISSLNIENESSGSQGNRRKQQKKNKKKIQKDQRRDESATPQDNLSTTPAADDNSNPRKSCNTCGGSFDSAASYRAHFKSDWHRFNQKLKLKGVNPISEEEFKQCDADTFFGGDGDMQF